MKHPLDFLPDKNRKPIFWVFLGWTLILFMLFQPLNQPTMTASAPNGIISLQLARTADNAQTMIDSWDTNARLFAAFGLGFDYLFMTIYTAALALGTLLAAGRHPGWFAKLGNWAAYATLFTFLCDALENLGQFHQLFNARVDLAPVVSLFATIKFSLLLLALAYGLIGWFWPKKR